MREVLVERGRAVGAVTETGEEFRQGKIAPLPKSVAVSGLY